MTAISFENVSKLYQIGQARYGTLRDDLAAFADRFLRRSKWRDAPAATRRAFWALKDVSFTVERGEAMGIVGPNGAGKSTVLKLLARVTAPMRGSIRVNGKVAALIELTAGFHPELTGRENIFLNGSIMGMTRREVRRKFDSIVTFSGLEDFIDTPVKRYSSGMHARLGFAVAAHVEPEILLIDEVLAVGDASFQGKCFQKMDEFRREGTTIVFVSHNLEAVRNLCPTTILLNHGQIALMGPTETTLAKYHELFAQQMLGSSNTRGNGISGERKACILRIDLFNAAREPARTFLAGEPAFVVYTVEFNSSIDSPTFGLGVRRLDRLIVVDTDSARLGTPTGRRQAGDVLQVEFAIRMNLANGIYQITGHILDQNRRDFYDFVDAAITFRVREDYSVQQTVAHLEPRARIVKMEKAAVQA